MSSSIRWLVLLCLGIAPTPRGATVRAQAPPPVPLPIRTQVVGPAIVQPPLGSVPLQFARWEKEIAAFEQLDRTSPPPKGGILFVGSSTIRLWETLAEDYRGLPVINRGFGGSEIADSTHFADRIIFPYEPKQIVLRAGTNDIHNGKVPSLVAHDFQQFVLTVRARLPRTEILYVGGNATPSRWSENDKIQATNKLIREMAVEMPFVAYIDAYDIAIGPTGQARPELFVADRLHFNPDGYKLLAERVRPYLPQPK